MVFGEDLLQSLGKIADQAAADAARVHLVDLYARILKKSAVDADLPEFIFDKHEILSGKGFGNHLLYESRLAGPQKSGKNIDLGHW